MSDFASAAMVRVLAQGMRELGLDPGCVAPSKPAASAKVELDMKRALLLSAVRQGGIGCLPLLGRGLRSYACEPTQRALASATDVPDLLARWSRLERYVHSRHRVAVRYVGNGRADLCHIALGDKPAPLPVENLVVLGVLAALLESLGLREVKVRAGKVPTYPLPDITALERAVQAGRTATWQFTWRAVHPGSKLPHRATSWGPTLIDDGPWPSIGKETCRLLAADLMTPLRVTELARALHMSPRTLQRNLSRAGLSYSAVLSEARCRAGAWWLLNSQTPIAEIGFLCGYADQPHFTRDFGLRVGLTPAKYRDEFMASRPKAH